MGTTFLGALLMFDFVFLNLNFAIIHYELLSNGIKEQLIMSIIIIVINIQVHFSMD